MLMIGIQARTKREAFDCKLKPFITGATAMVKLGTLSIAYHRNYASYMIHTLGAVIGQMVLAVTHLSQFQIRMVEML